MSFLWDCSRRLRYEGTIPCGLTSGVDLVVSDVEVGRNKHAV